MALLPQSPREQKLFVMALVAVGLVGIYQQLYWSPKHDEQVTLSARLDTLDSLNLLAKAEVAKGNSAKMRAEGDAYARELAVLRHLVPTSNEVPALLESISNAARRAGLEISEVSPDAVMNGDRLDTYKYKLGVTGPYHQIAEFLTNVASLPRIVAPINLTLAPTARANLERRPQKEERFLDAKFGVQTYVEHVAPTPAKAGQP
ncbi:MAG TPA: type 4a pilus biogenesis protein PilO [Gemmatimonadaceae bacterium]|jgi:type IV pilus assembly protein PilO